MKVKKLTAEEKADKFPFKPSPSETERLRRYRGWLAFLRKERAAGWRRRTIRYIPGQFAKEKREVQSGSQAEGSGSGASG